MRSAARHAVSLAVQSSGLGWLYVQLLNVSGAIVLMYHSVPDRESSGWIDPQNSLPLEVFERQMRFLSRYRHVISMDQLVDAIARKTRLPTGSVVLTFDDGYKDNLYVVAPILERYRLPAMLYLATEYINRAQNQWIDELLSIFAHRTAHAFESESGGGWQLDDAGTIVHAHRSVAAGLLGADIKGREQILARLAGQLRPDARPPRLTLNWDEVRELVRRYPQFEIGAHTADHVDLRAHGVQAEDQIARSVSDIQRELGFKPVHFSFPYGRYCEQAQKAASTLGMRSAVVAGLDVLMGSNSDPLGLPRVAAPASPTLLRYYTSGAHPGLTKALLGHA